MDIRLELVVGKPKDTGEEGQGVRFDALETTGQMHASDMFQPSVTRPRTNGALDESEQKL